MRAAVLERMDDAVLVARDHDRHVAEVRGAEGVRLMEPTPNLDQLYQDIILDHYRHPHGRGLREPYAAEAHHVNPTCGDEVTVRVTADLSDISYDGMGCSISQASASVLHDLLRGRDAASAFAVHDAFVRLLQGRGQVEGQPAF